MMSDNSKIEFDTAGSPRSAHGDVPELDHFVAINEFLAGRFFDSAPDLSAHCGQYINFDVVVLELHYFPFLLFADLTISFEEIVWIHFIGLRLADYRGGVAVRISDELALFLGDP